MGEIDSSSLTCNGCWLALSEAAAAYKTSCSHLFCRPCAEGYFSSSTLCPLCDARLGGDGDIVELPGDKSPTACLHFFALAAFHPDTALRLLTDAVAFSRAQTALYGTREAWKRGQEGEGLKRRLVEAENRLHTLVGELSGKAGEVADLQDRLALKTKELAAQKAERKRLEEAYSRATGGRGGALLLAGAEGGGGPSPMGEGAAGGGLFGGGGGHTVVLCPPAALGAARRDSVSSSRGGGGGGGGFPGAPSPSAFAAAQAAQGRYAAQSLLRPITPLVGPGFRSAGGGGGPRGAAGGGGQPSLFPSTSAGAGGGWGGSGGR